MLQEKLASIAAITQGEVLHGAPELPVRGHFTDTRSPVIGGLFVALRGERFDGNAYARDAADRLGAAAVLVDRPEALHAFPEKSGAILVDDTRDAYLRLAAWHRCKLPNCLWLGVTGSVGKSTTKDMLAHILGAANPTRVVHKAPGSFNNNIGLSKTILDTAVGADAAVLELGTNHPGEIAPLAAVARPSIAVITCAAESHLEAFETVENVAREKGAILKFQDPEDTAVLNADDLYFEYWKSEARGKVLSFGFSESADLRATNITLDNSGCARFGIDYKFGSAFAICTLRVPGTHQVSNALAAIGASMSAGDSLESACTAAGTYEGTARRFSVHRAGGATLVDDAYNANPASFKAALDTLTTLSATRRFVVVGGMMELGAQSEARHRELGAILAKLDLAGLCVVGDLARPVGEAAIQCGQNSFSVNYLPSPEAAADTLGQILRPGDAALVKGSHSIQLERCVHGLLKKLKAS